MRLALKLGHAVAIAGLLSGLAATPALADHDHHHGRDRHGNQHGAWEGRYYRDYDYGYDRHYYYREPYVAYYAPRVYVPLPPPPPSFGLSLVFPFHHH
jgi:hypothetical protein